MEKYNYNKILKNTLVFILAIFVFYLAIKFSLFYMPFLIAYVISVIIEPIIKFLKNKCNISRRASTILVVLLFFTILIIAMSWGIVTLVREMNEFLKGMNIYLEQIMSYFQSIWQKVEDLQLSNDINVFLQNGIVEIFNKSSNIIKVGIDNILKSITSIPKIFIYSVITILSTYFLCSDKIYILDRLEHHVPRKIVGKIRIYNTEILSALGGYLKAEAILVLISFIITTIGLHIFYFMGMNVKYPFLFALFISFIDALPILGSGTVFIPWILINFINGDKGLAFSLLGLYILTIIVRQIIEPKIVSNKIGIHPIFTLLAMYTGFKIVGVIGMLLGPVLLIIIKSIFADILDRGIIKTLIE